MTKNYPEEFEKFWKEESGWYREGFDTGGSAEKVLAEETWDKAFELGKYEGITWGIQRREECDD